MKMLRLVFADLNGCMKGKLIPASDFEASKKSGMARSTLLQDIDGIETDQVEGFTPQSGDLDMFLVPDIATHTKAYGNEQNLEQVIVDLYDENNQPLDNSPRQILKNQIKKLTDLGMTAKIATELEFYILNQDWSIVNPDEIDQPYADINAFDKFQTLFNDFLEGTASVGLKAEALSSECGPGAFELNFNPDEPLAMADKSFYFKQMIREVSRRHNYRATFLAKPFAELPSCGCHFHISLSKDGQNVRSHYPDIWESFMAGIIHCADDLYALSAPNPNSYRRIALTQGYIPTKPNISEGNRLGALRLVGEDDNARVEYRVSGSDVNIYLVMSALLASGIYGIENNLRLDSPEIVGKMSVDFADNLPEAIDNLNNSTLARQLFGDRFVDSFVTVKQQEILTFQKQITKWEMERYGSLV